MIFCVEDDESIRSLELYTLQSAGIEARGFGDGASFLAALRTQKPELVILDVMLPGESGVELLGRMKASGETCEIPVIMATARGAEYDKIQSLDLGADDYLVKPFAFEELMARIRCVSRRPHALTVDDSFTVADVTWQSSGSILTGPAGRCTLSKKEAALMEIFLHSKEQTLPRNTLLMKVWGPDSNVEEGNLDNYIHFLRRRLQNTGSSLQIKTVRGIGYSLTQKQ